MSAEPDILRRYRARVEAALAERLPQSAVPPARLHEALRYAVLGGGKRVRACLVYAAGRALGADDASLDVPACAVELIHAYSLVHDDLPCMDNDDLRRGRPTVHKAYDEATALLVGDALQSLAFDWLAGDAALQVEPARRMDMIATLARACGPAGMVGGQAIDLASTGKPLTPAALEDMHRRKTGALMIAAVQLGALASNPPDATQQNFLTDYARALGLAFQIADDILDIEGESAKIGKSTGKDRAQNKPTYVSLLGLAHAREKMRALRDEAMASLNDIRGDTKMLAALADYCITRDR